MSTNMAMVEYFIGEFYSGKLANLDVLVTEDFTFKMLKSPTLNFSKFVIMAKAISNLVKLNVYDMQSNDDQIFKMKYLLDVMIPTGGFGTEIFGTIIVTVKDNLVRNITVTRSRIDEDLQKHMPE